MCQSSQCACLWPPCCMGSVLCNAHACTHQHAAKRNRAQRLNPKPYFAHHAVPAAPVHSTQLSRPLHSPKALASITSTTAATACCKCSTLPLRECCDGTLNYSHTTHVGWDPPSNQALCRRKLQSTLQGATADWTAAAAAAVAAAWSVQC